MPERKLRFTRQHFERVVSKHQKSFAEISNQYPNTITDNDALFTIEDLIEICRLVAKGMWENAAMSEKPNSKWGQEYRSKVIRKVILEAFAA